jgi:predicted RNA polymerase sigma factor
MGYNAATMLEKLGHPEEALAAYDRAMELEGRYARNFVAEHKAAFLHRLGRVADSLRLYEDLARRTTLTEAERYRIAQNVQTLRQQAG